MSADRERRIGRDLGVAGDYQQAMLHLEAALRIDPDHVRAHDDLGVCLRDLGRLPEAIAHHRRAVEIDPNYANARRNLGDALVRAGEVEEGIEHLRSAIELDPDDARAFRVLGRALALPGIRKALFASCDALCSSTPATRWRTTTSAAR